MTSRRAARTTFACPIALGMVAVIVASCSSSATSTTTEPTLFAALESTSSVVEQTTTTLVAKEGFEEIVLRTMPVETDAPEGYTFANVDLGAEFGGFCDDSSPASDRWPAAAAGATTFEGDHFFRTDVVVYANQADARAAGRYQSNAILSCDQSIRTDADTGEVIRLSSRDDGPYALPGADEADTKSIRIATDSFGIDTVHIQARSDNVVLTAQGSDPETTAYFMDLLIARLLGEADPATVVPSDRPGIIEVDELD